MWRQGELGLIGQSTMEHPWSKIFIPVRVKVDGSKREYTRLPGMHWRCPDEDGSLAGKAWWPLMATEQERVPSGVLPVPPAPSSVLSPLVLLEPVSSISQGSDGACWGSFEAGGSLPQCCWLRPPPPPSPILPQPIIIRIASPPLTVWPLSCISTIPACYWCTPVHSPLQAGSLESIPSQVSESKDPFGDTQPALTHHQQLSRDSMSNSHTDFDCGVQIITFDA